MLKQTSLCANAIKTMECPKAVGSLYCSLFRWVKHYQKNPCLLEEEMVSTELKLNFQNTPQQFQGI